MEEMAEMEFNRLMAQFMNTEYYHLIREKIEELKEQDLEVIKACELEQLKELQGRIQRTEIILSIIEDSAQRWRESEEKI